MVDHRKVQTTTMIVHVLPTSLAKCSIDDYDSMLLKACLIVNMESRSSFIRCNVFDNQTIKSTNASFACITSTTINH